MINLPVAVVRFARRVLEWLSKINNLCRLLRGFGRWFYLLPC